MDRLLTDGVLASACPSRVLLDHVTSKWGVLLLVALSERSMRWGELRRVVEGISEKMLAQTLRTLEADELVARLLPLMAWVADHADAIVGDAATR